MMEHIDQNKTGQSESLSQHQIEVGLRQLLRDGMASQTMGTLTGGAFLVAFAIKLGASNFVIGLLASIGPLAQLLQIPGVYLVEVVRKRKRITLFAAGIARVLWLAIIVLPFLYKKDNIVFVLLAILSATAGLGAIAGCSWNSWMRDLIPEKIMGSFFAKRMRYAVLAGIIVSLLAAGFLDLWAKFAPNLVLSGYIILFGVGLSAGLLGLFFISKIPEPPMAKSAEKVHLFKAIILPFRDRNYRKLITFLCTWNFAVNLAAPFFMVYMLNRLGLSMTWIIGLSILSQFMNYIFLSLWGRFTDLFSNKSVLAICAPLFILSIAAWPFTTLPEKHVFTIPLLIIIHMIMGIASAGIALSSGNISLKLAPKGQATSYLASNTVMNSLAAGIAPILGGKCVDFFSYKQIALNLTYTDQNSAITLSPMNLQSWDFFFLLAFLIGFFSLQLLFRVQEVGQVDEKIVFREFVSEVRMQVRTLSSVESIRSMVSFPIGIIKNLSGQNNIHAAQKNPDDVNIPPIEQGADSQERD